MSSQGVPQGSTQAAAPCTAAAASRVEGLESLKVFGLWNASSVWSVLCYTHLHICSTLRLCQPSVSSRLTPFAVADS